MLQHRIPIKDRNKGICVFKISGTCEVTDRVVDCLFTGTREQAQSVRLITKEQCLKEGNLRSRRVFSSKNGKIKYHPYNTSTAESPEQKLYNDT